MDPAKELTEFDSLIADAVIGIDTLWGGDVMHPSGTGRLIADTWFSGAPLPRAYTHPTAARLRETGGVGAKNPDRRAIESYVAAINVRGAIQKLADTLKALPARVLTVFEGGIGFGFLAMVIAYLPVLYEGFSRREINISMLDARAGSPPTAGELLR